MVLEEVNNNCPFAILHALKKWDGELSENSAVFFAGDMETDILAAVNASKAVPYKIIPVAIGSQSRAAAELRILWKEEAVEDGIIFADYGEFLRYLENCPQSARLEQKASPAPVTL